MKTCTEYEEKLWPAVYGELSPEKQPVLATHIRQCPDCYRKISEISAMIRAVRETAPVPELSEWEKENISRSVLRALKEEKTGWQNCLAFLRTRPGLLTASLLLLFTAWSGIRIWQKPAPVLQTEEIQIIQNYELISNLELLEEMEHLEKVVETLDRKQYGESGNKRILPVRKADDNEKQA